jgi:RNA polymerase sigma-70 factor (ECF subfamily)
VNLVAPSGDLLRRAQSGDHAAFTSLIRGCDERMRRLAHRVLGDPTSADDALQDAYVKAYRNLATFDGRSTFSTWLYTIVYRTCLDQIRSRNRRAEVDLSTVGEQPGAGSDHAARHADADALTQALHDLPPDQIAAVVLVEVDGCTYEEAAKILGVAEGTVSSRVTRARQALRDRLGDSTDERSRP